MTLMKQIYAQETLSLTVYGCSILGVLKIICDSEDERQHFSVEFYVICI
jgi:hypothetical protein